MHNHLQTEHLYEIYPFVKENLRSNESSSLIINNSEPLTYQGESVELKPPCLNPSSETVDIDKKAEASQPSHNIHDVDQSELPNSAEDASKKSQDSNAVVKEPDKSQLNGSTECILSYDKQDEQDKSEF